jgi:hypothetical protein
MRALKTDPNVPMHTHTCIKYMYTCKILTGAEEGGVERVGAVGRHDHLLSIVVIGGVVCGMVEMVCCLAHTRISLNKTHP